MPEHTAPLSEEAAKQEAHRLIRDAYRPTSYRDTSPVPQHGTAPPVPQPGRPPMSQRATDISGVMLAGSIACVPVGGMACLVLLALDQVDRVSLAIAAAAPIALGLVISLLLHRAKDVLPEEHHHHYSGNVYQQQNTTNSRSVWAKNINEK
ncbi:hypothetical protein ACFYVK_35290 [Streptomyces chartreusis]|uniref:hypothetical protein n=1 Tax=Streptomyces chartreusis TaxID=1969 RepID=UPI0036853B1C